MAHTATQGKTTKTLRREQQANSQVGFVAGGWAKKILKKRNNFKIQKNLQGVKHNFYHFCRFFHFFVKGC